MTIKQLFELQMLDSEIDSHTKSLNQINAEMGDDTKLNALENRILELKTLLESEFLKRKPVELEIKSIEEKLSSIEDRLYNGVITNPRELEAQETERNHLKETRSSQEDILLESMLITENIENELTNAEQAVSKYKANREIEHPGLMKQKSTLTESLKTLSSERSEFIEDIARIELTMYDALRQNKGGLAISRVQRGSCEACRLTLPKTELQRARTSDGPVYCSSCKRILFIP